MSTKLVDMRITFCGQIKTFLRLLKLNQTLLEYQQRIQQAATQKPVNEKAVIPNINNTYYDCYLFFNIIYFINNPWR